MSISSRKLAIDSRLRSHSVDEGSVGRDGGGQDEGRREGQRTVVYAMSPIQSPPKLFLSASITQPCQALSLRPSCPVPIFLRPSACIDLARTIKRIKTYLIRQMGSICIAIISRTNQNRTENSSVGILYRSMHLLIMPYCLAYS